MMVLSGPSVLMSAAVVLIVHLILVPQAQYAYI